jgi:hypothetical protein
MVHDQNSDACPKCLSTADVRQKKILIGKDSPAKIFPNYAELAGYRRKDQIATDECNPEYLDVPPLDQFVDGLYCEKCGVGFIAGKIAKSSLKKTR